MIRTDVATIGTGLLVLLISAGTVHLLFYWLVYRRFAFLKVAASGGETKPVSVIICARNESKNLQRFLPAVLDQAYPEYEVIVVNDCSWDDSGEYLEAAEKEYPRLRVVNIQEQEKYKHGKKFAITLGIKAAKHDRLLFTDADCRPASRNWLTNMQYNFRDGKEIVLGYGAYERMPGFLNKLIRFDTAFIAMQYFGFALGGNAYMGTGRNLAYRKDLFFRNKGFARHNHLPSGDDDLFVNENATSANTAIEVQPDSFTYSLPKERFADWFNQKVRHTTTSKYYKAGHRFQLFLAGICPLLVWLSLIALLVSGQRTKEALVAAGVVWGLKLPIFAYSASKLREKDLIWLYPLLELLYSFLLPIIYLAQLLTKKRAWK